MKRAVVIGSITLGLIGLGLYALGSAGQESPSKPTGHMMEIGKDTHGELEPGKMPHGEAPHGEMAMSSTMGGHDGEPLEGKKIYNELCASCHGASGRGDGPVGLALNPKPADFTKHAHMHGDEYFFDVIQKGGSAVGKSPAMPAWGGQLSEEATWDVISYLKTFAEGH